MSNVHKGTGTASRASKPDLWYYDQLPPTARAALQNSIQDWSSAYFFNRWNRAARGYKTGGDVAARVREADKRARAKK